jgi:micrococcal nuclease
MRRLGGAAVAVLAAVSLSLLGGCGEEDPTFTPAGNVDDDSGGGGLDLGDDDRNCDDFGSQEEAQAFYEAAGPGDPHGLDRDDDGRACESD